VLRRGQAAQAVQVLVPEGQEGGSWNTTHNNNEKIITLIIMVDDRHWPAAKSQSSSTARGLAQRSLFILNKKIDLN